MLSPGDDGAPTRAKDAGLRMSSFCSAARLGMGLREGIALPEGRAGPTVAGTEIREEGLLSS